jgi:hypothetical protein
LPHGLHDSWIGYHNGPRIFCFAAWVWPPDFDRNTGLPILSPDQGAVFEWETKRFFVHDEACHGPAQVPPNRLEMASMLPNIVDFLYLAASLNDFGIAIDVDLDRQTRA